VTLWLESWEPEDLNESLRRRDKGQLTLRCHGAARLILLPDSSELLDRQHQPGPVVASCAVLYCTLRAPGPEIADVPALEDPLVWGLCWNRPRSHAWVS